MRSLPSRGSPDSGSGSDSKNKLINTIVEWGAKTEDFEDIDDLDIRYKIIEIANRKIKLSDALRQYSIQFDETFSNSGWDLRTTCPFPAHKNGHERTPSFYYNPKEGWFTCFGCTAKGKAVEFIAFMRCKNPFEIAQEIISQYGSLEAAIEEANDSEDINIDQEIFNFSIYIREFIQKHKNDSRAIKYAENVLWSFDVYISANIRKGIFAEELSARISKHKEALECFGEPENV